MNGAVRLKNSTSAKRLNILIHLGINIDVFCHRVWIKCSTIDLWFEQRCFSTLAIMHAGQLFVPPVSSGCSGCFHALWVMRASAQCFLGFALVDFSFLCVTSIHFSSGIGSQWILHHCALPHLCFPHQRDAIQALSSVLFHRWSSSSDPPNESNKESGNGHLSLSMVSSTGSKLRDLCEMQPLLFLQLHSLIHLSFS